jgi:hypothetical protein
LTTYRDGQHALVITEASCFRILDQTEAEAAPATSCCAA